jgi:hypothetical protein
MPDEKNFTSRISQTYDELSKLHNNGVTRINFSIEEIKEGYKQAYEGLKTLHNLSRSINNLPNFYR